MNRLGDAELEIMQVIWKEKNPVTSNNILNELKGKRNWGLSTLMTVLSRLENKGYIFCDRSTRTNMYSTIIKENDYMTHESKNFLNKLYDNSIQRLISTLYSNNVIENTDLAELRQFLDELEGEDNI